MAADAATDAGVSATGGFDPDTMQRLLLWRLAVAEEGGMFLKNLESDPGAARRGKLLKAGLIATEKRKTPKGSTAGFLTLTDAGWGWCQDHLGDDLPGRAVKADRAVLERLLKLLGGYLGGGGARPAAGSFGELVSAAREAGGEVHQDETPRGEAAASGAAGTRGERGDRSEAILAACRTAGGGAAGVRVRLSDLRPRLDGLPREELDAALLALERDGRLALSPLDDPRDIRPEDHAAALATPVGSVRHLVHLRS